MKVIIALAALVCVAVAAPQKGPEADAVIVKSNVDNIGIDGYTYDIETSNGIAQQETGQVVNQGTENESINVQGQYSYTGPDGVRYQVAYIANDDGFQPQGAHIPQNA